MKQILLAGFIALSLFSTACKSDSTATNTAVPANHTTIAPAVDNTPKELLVKGFESTGKAYPIVKEFTMPKMDACEGSLEDFQKALTNAGMVWLKNPGKLDEWTEADQQKFSPEAAVLVPTKNGNYTAIFIEFAYHALNNIDAYTLTLDKNGNVMDEQEQFIIALCNEGEGNYKGALKVDANTIKYEMKVEGADDEIKEIPTK